MGVSTTTNRVLYNGDGSTTSFSFPYYFFHQSDLLVFLYNTVTNAISTMVLNTDYSISGTANYQGIYPSGANVVFNTAPTNSPQEVVVIVRAGTLEQLFSLSENGPIPSATLVQQLDYLTLLVQRLQDQINLVPIVPDGVGVSWSNELPATIAAQPGAFLCVNSNGNGFTLANGQWNSTVIPYATIQTAALTNSALILALPSNVLLTGLFMVTTAGFSGSGISSIVASIGTASDNSYFTSTSSIASANAWDGGSDFYLGSLTASTNINAYFTAVGANLSSLSAGSLTVFYKTEAL